MGAFGSLISSRVYVRLLLLRSSSLSYSPGLFACARELLFRLRRRRGIDEAAVAASWGLMMKTGRRRRRILRRPSPWSRFWSAAEAQGRRADNNKVVLLLQRAERSTVGSEGERSARRERQRRRLKFAGCVCATLHFRPLPHSLARWSCALRAFAPERLTVARANCCFAFFACASESASQRVSRESEQASGRR